MTYQLDEFSTGSGFKGQDAVGETVAKYNLLHVNSSGVWVKANAVSGTKMPCSAIACEAINSGLRGTLLFCGIINNNAWSWTPGGLIYTATIDGGLTQTTPNTSGNRVQIVGRALSATLILFNPDFYMTAVG